MFGCNCETRRAEGATNPVTAPRCQACQARLFAPVSGRVFHGDETGLVPNTYIG